MAGQPHARRNDRNGRPAVTRTILRLVVIAGMAGGLAACGLVGDDPALSGPGTGAMGDDFNGEGGGQTREARARDEAPQAEEEAPDDVDIDLGSPVRN